MTAAHVVRTESRLLARGWPPDHPRVARAEGRTLWTAEGRRLLDGASGALSATIGYGVREIADAVAAQARELAFAHSLHFTTKAAESYAADLAAVLGTGQAGEARGQILFVTGGSEANEMALLLSHRIQALRGAPGRTVFLSRHLSYHGSTLATLALGARQRLRAGVDGLLARVAHLPPPYPYRPEWHERFPEAVAGVDGLSDVAGGSLSEDAVARGRADPAEALAVAIETLGPERVCAFVAEPIIGASGGAIVPPDDYWPQVQEICRENGVLLILDEVMTGMGRTGAWLASSEWGLQPDIVTLGKGLAGSYVPLGAVAVRAEHWRGLSDAPPGFPYGFTFAQHPVAAAAGHAVLAFLKEHGLLERATALGRWIRDALADATRANPHVGEIRGRGLLCGVELVRDQDRRTPFPWEWNATARLLAAAEEAGVLLYPATGGADGIAGDAFLLAPALTTTDAEAQVLVDATAVALDRLTGAWKRR